MDAARCAWRSILALATTCTLAPWTMACSRARTAVGPGRSFRGSNIPGSPRSPSRPLTVPSTPARSLPPCSSASTAAAPGGSWRSMRKLPSGPAWSFPPRPWTSHVRAIALSYVDPDLVVVGIELGGVREKHRRRRDLAGPEARRPARLPLPVRASRSYRPTVRGRGRRVRQEHRFWGQLGIVWTKGWACTTCGDWPWTRKTPRLSTLRLPRDRTGRTAGARRARQSTGKSRGEPWQAALEGLDAFPYALCPDPETPGVLYAGLGDGTILRGAETGESWEEVARVAPGLQALAAVSA